MKHFFYLYIIRTVRLFNKAKTAFGYEKATNYLCACSGLFLVLIMISISEIFSLRETYLSDYNENYYNRKLYFLIPAIIYSFSFGHK